MRITRSGLRRIIAEESARILAETKKRDQSPRDRLAAYLDRVGADSAAIMSAVDRAVDRAHEEGSEVTSEDITFNLSDEVLDAIPEDDSDRWHSMLDAVLADEIDPDAFADAERDRQDIEDTERDLSHPSRFLEEGDDDSESEDQDDAFMDDLDREAGMADYRHAHSMGGRSDEEGFAIDYDTGRPSPFAAKHLARPAAAVDDIDGGEDMGEVDPYEMGEYEHAHSMGGGADEEGFYMDYDRGSRKKGISEARWAKLAGILKG